MGGVFGLEPRVPATRERTCPWMGKPALRLANARSCLAVLVAHLRPPTVWLPAYVCGAVLQAFAGSPAAVRYYAVDATLGVRSGAWVAEVQANDLVVLIDYFGRLAPADVAAAVRRRGAWLVEDASQAFLSAGVGQQADFVVFSPRKFVGVPDGGVLVSNTSVDLSRAATSPAPQDWWGTALAASIGRRQFDAHGGDRTWFAHFQQAERESPVGPFAMSPLSRDLLETGIDYATLARRRLANYRQLAGELADLALFPELPAGSVPLGFPIRVERRDALRTFLFGHHIYPAVHWPLDGVVPASFETSHALAASILTLPCDQRYAEPDMARLARLVRHGATR